MPNAPPTKSSTAASTSRPCWGVISTNEADPAARVDTVLAHLGLDVLVGQRLRCERGERTGHRTGDHPASAAASGPRRGPRALAVVAPADRSGDLVSGAVLRAVGVAGGQAG